MHQLLNTLYITAEGAYLHLDHDTLKVEVEKETRLQVPIHHLDGIVIFGNVMVSPSAMHRCAEDGRSLVLLDRNGRFKAHGSRAFNQGDSRHPCSNRPLLWGWARIETDVRFAKVEHF